MDTGAVARYEWLLILGVVLALAVWELVQVKRASRRAREAEEARQDRETS